MEIALYDPAKTAATKYLFFTGKGGVGKTSIACATAVSLADAGEKILLVSTDPASNLQDVFGIPLNDAGVAIADVPRLIVANLDPLTAAAEYRESVIGAYRGKLPDSAIKNVEEQLSGSCTVEIAAFNAFSEFLTNSEKAEEFDHIIFDTAPTGHTLRMLQLPSAWSGFISESKHGASCLGQLSGLEDKKEMYKKAVHTLADTRLTTIILVTRPETAPIREAQRASHELEALEIRNQVLVINGLLETYDANDTVETALFKKQQEALQEIPRSLVRQSVTRVPLRAYNITGVDHVRQLLSYSGHTPVVSTVQHPNAYTLSDVVDEIEASNKKVIFTMGKGGVGKTTIAAAIALGLHRKGKKVRLATTDPADHLNLVMGPKEDISVSHIDEKGELKKYQEEVLAKARQTMPEDDLEYVKEDLRSPCTQEIAVFRAFADIVAKSRDEIVVLDTAPTGHTILLLESTQNYNQQIENSGGDVSDAEKELLPRLKDPNETEVIIVTLAETTPFYEAKRLLDDLKRAGLAVRWWVINASYSTVNTKSDFLKAKAATELQWIHEVDTISNGQYAVIPWKPFEVKDEKLLELL